MKIKKILVLVFSLFLFLINFVNGSELGGIKILQSTDDFITLDDNDKRKRKYNNNVKIYLNNSFNLSSEESSKNAKNWNDFIIPKPDFFYNSYFVYEKEKKIIKIYSVRLLSHKEPQSTFKVGECESLKKQLMLEKLGSKFDESNRLKQYSRSANDDRFYFKDRTIFNYKIENNNISHLFTCNYKIEYIDNVNNSGEHLVTNLLFESISLNDEFVKEEKFSNHKQIEKFNSNFIKNFKIWGNVKGINYDNNETYSLNDYRLKSLLKHNEIKTLQKIEIEKEKQKKADEEKKRLEQEKLDVQKKIKAEKITKLKKKIVNKEKILFEQITFLKKPINELNKKKDIELKEATNLLIRFEDQENSFKSNFRRTYDACFPSSISHFVSPAESANAKLTLIGNDSVFVKYSINYAPFSDNDKSLFYLDFVKVKTDCQILFKESNKFDTLDLININFRLFNSYENFNLETPKINSKTISKLDQLIEEAEKINKEIEENNKIISLKTKELKRIFNFEADKIEKQISELEKNYISKKISLPKKDLKKIKTKETKQNPEKVVTEVKQVSEFEKKELFDSNNISALVDKSKIESAETNKKLDKITQDQDRNIENTKLTLGENDSLTAQIFGCWSVPFGLSLSNDMVVRIKLDLNPDGSIEKMEMLDHIKMNTPGKEEFRTLADSVKRAVQLCNPLRVPATGYERWKNMVLTFDATEILAE